MLLSRFLIQIFEFFAICCASQKTLIELILNRKENKDPKDNQLIKLFFKSLLKYAFSIKKYLI